MRTFSRGGGRFGRPRPGPMPTSPLLPSSSSFPSSPSGSVSQSSVFERERTTTESVIKPQGPRSKRDRLLEFFSDWRYHSAYDLDRLDGFSPGDWVVEVRSLIEYGFAFSRRANSLIMRHGTGKPQDLAELLAGIDARFPEDANVGDKPTSFGRLAESQEVQPVVLPRVDKIYEQEEESEFSEEADSSFEFDVSSDSFVLPPEDDRISLSEDPSVCILPAKTTVTSTMAILAMKRQGKTYLAMVLAEEFLKKNFPFVAFDPTGVWHGLLYKADGSPTEHEIVLLGGKHGHFPIHYDQGATCVALVLDLWPQSFVFDLSDMEPAKQHAFVADFANHLYILSSKPIHVFFDEADEIAPQVPNRAYPHQRRCLSVVDRLVRRGGVKGVGSTLITQRPAVVNKNVLSQVNRMMILKTVAPHDLGAIEDWCKPIIPQHARRVQYLAEVPSLKKGEVICIQSDEGAIPIMRFRSRIKETFDTSKTPSLDDVPFALEARSLSPELAERVRNGLYRINAPVTSSEDPFYQDEGDEPEVD